MDETLEDYYTKDEMDAALGDRYTKQETDTKLEDYYKKTETYDKDEVDSIVAALSRQEYIVAWDGLAAPDVSAIPAGVTVTYNATPYTGTLAASASTVNKIYMVWNGVAYDMYGTSQDGGYSWVPMGTTTVDLSQYATKAELSQLQQEVIADISQLEAKETEKTGGEYSPILTIEQGAINSSDGENVENYTRLRTQNFIVADGISITTSGSKVYVMGYTSDGTFVSARGWNTSSIDIFIDGAKKYRCVFAFSNDANITPSDFSSLGVVIKGINYGTLATKAELLGVSSAMADNDEFAKYTYKTPLPNIISKEYLFEGSALQKVQTLSGKALYRTGSIDDAPGYTVDVYNVSPGDIVKVRGKITAATNIGVFAFFKDFSNNKPILTKTVGDYGGESGVPLSVDEFVLAPFGTTSIAVCYYSDNISVYSVDDTKSIKGKIQSLESEINLNTETLDYGVVGYEELEGTDGHNIIVGDGTITEDASYGSIIVDVTGLKKVKLVGTCTIYYTYGVYGFYNDTPSKNTQILKVTGQDITGQSGGGVTATLDTVIDVPDGAKYLLASYYIPYDEDMVAYRQVFDSMRLYNLENGTKYVDCLGDSLTMGSSWDWMGNFEDELQELLGNKYQVRNWGVGGETSHTIMARQGSTQIKFPHTFVLPANGDEVEVANGSISEYMKTVLSNADVTPLLQPQGNNDGRNYRVNPCYIGGVECTLTRYKVNGAGSELDITNIRYTLKRNAVGDRDITFPQYEPLYFKTGREMAKSDITIIWMGTNDGISTTAGLDSLLERQKIATEHINNGKYIVIGLHLLANTASPAIADYYEDLMSKHFGNKFFNIRMYAATNMIYDAGFTPTADDLDKMANHKCPSSLLLDGTHFKPESNRAIGQRLYEMIIALGY